MACCPSCGKEAGVGLICGYCGARVAEEPVSAPVVEVPSEDPAGWICAKCGAGNDLDGRFCFTCGATASAAVTAAVAPLRAQGWTCTSCGAVDEDDSLFCCACGTQRPGVSQTTAAESAVAFAGPARDAPTQHVPVAPPGPQSGFVPPPPGGGAAERPPAGSSRLPWVVAMVVVIAVVAAGAAYMVGRGAGGGDSPAQTASAQTVTTSSDGGGDSSTGSGASTADSGTANADDMTAYLGDIETLIVQAGHGRDGIAKATSAYGAHRMSADKAAALIQAVIDNRNSVLKSLRSLSMPGNAAAGCRTAFVKAMIFSVKADQHYLDWVMGSGSVAAADPANQLAGYWKQKFVSQYNRLARKYGMRHSWVDLDI